MDKWITLGRHGIAVMAFPETQIELVITICEFCEQSHHSQRHLPFKSNTNPPA
jgi:hypothetical protein